MDGNGALPSVFKQDDDSFGPRTIVLPNGRSAEVICMISTCTRAELHVQFAPWFIRMLCLHTVDEQAVIERMADHVRMALFRELHHAPVAAGEGN